MPYDTEWSQEYLESDGKGIPHQVTKLGEYRAFAALARAQGQRDAARYWQELAYAEQRQIEACSCGNPESQERTAGE